MHENELATTTTLTHQRSDVLSRSRPNVLRGRPRAAGQVLVTRVGLDLPGIVDFATWERAGVKIARIADSSAWCLGDWLIYGQDRFPDRYRRAISAAGLDYQTLRNYAWVARKFELGRRRVQLSFQHHAEVAALSQEDQDRWLGVAEEQGWSRNELRANIRMARHGSASAAAIPLPILRPPAERLDRWREAAALQSQDLEDWIMATLDASASHVLSARGALEQVQVAGRTGPKAATSPLA